MAEAALNPLERSLGEVLAAIPQSWRLALVGGIAVSARTVPRFTGDVDLVIAVTSDGDAEAIIHALIGARYQLLATLENTKHGRLGTARLKHTGSKPVIDLLFASSGVEAEIAAAATVETVFGHRVPVARVGHLIAMKLLARDDDKRPLDRADLLELAKVASDDEWQLAASAIELITQRGFSRDRDLGAALAEWRAKSYAST